MKTLSFSTDRKTVQDLANLYQGGHLDLNPAFQRNSVWIDRDRNKLIESILRGYPLPAIFLYEQTKGGNTHYAVIDGKQRLETILLFLGHLRGNFKAASVELPNPEDPDQMLGKKVSFNTLKKDDEQHRILSYKLNVISVEGDHAEIVGLFVLLNSTGKALTKAEARNAKFYQSPMLKKAREIANRFQKQLRSTGVISPAQQKRMKDIELVCDLLVSANQHDVISARTALDKTLDGTAVTGQKLSAAAKEVVAGLNNVFRMFPDLKSTRFHRLSDFYTLAVLVQKLARNGFVLKDPKRNEIAMRLLREFSNGVDSIVIKSRTVRGAAPSEATYTDYYLTLREGTTELRQRRKREHTLASVLEPLFEAKDSKRAFTPEQRRLIWNSTDEKRCAECERPLTWADVTFDHVFPHSRGGRTSVQNASLLCRAHNSAKGARV